MDKSCAGPLRGAQTLTFGRRQVPAELGWAGGGGRAEWGRRNSLAFAPLPLPFTPPGGRGRGAGAARGGGCPLSRDLGAGEPLHSPRPASRSRNWGNGVGDGAVQEKASASPSPLARSLSPPFPSASAWEIWALQSHTRAKGVLLGAYFFEI